MKLVKKLGDPNVSSKCYWSLLNGKKTLLNGKKFSYISPQFYGNKCKVDFQNSDIFNNYFLC